jgi:hypothetical protein
VPNVNLGYSASEVIQMLKDYTGNQSDDFESYISNEIAFSEFQYCKGHDWSFLYKLNLPLTVASGTTEYDLNTTTTGYYIAATDVINIYDTANNCLLRKTTVDDIRRRDPNNDDGTTNGGIKLWAPAGDNRIVVWPKQFSTTTLRIDAKITPFVFPTLTVGGITYTATAPNYGITVTQFNPGTINAALSVSVSGSSIVVNLATNGSGTLTSTEAQIVAAVNASAAASALVLASGSAVTVASASAATLIPKYFAMPYRYQHAYIEYLKGQALDRENDSRANNQKMMAKVLREADIEDDLSNLGDTILPRIKGAWEQQMDGATNDLNQAYNLWAFYGD